MWEKNGFQPEVMRATLWSNERSFIMPVRSGDAVNFHRIEHTPGVKPIRKRCPWRPAYAAQIVHQHCNLQGWEVYCCQDSGSKRRGESLRSCINDANQPHAQTHYLVHGKCECLSELSLYDMNIEASALVTGQLRIGFVVSIVGSIVPERCKCINCIDCT